MRELPDLINVPDPAWPGLARMLLHQHPRARTLPIEPAAGERCLYRLQVTARSTLGAIALHTGGLTVQHGWLRILGGGGRTLPSLADANGLDDPTPSSGTPPLLLVAFDVLGGRFAINGGGLPGDPYEVCYWGPDTLEWEPLAFGYTDFFHWTMTSGLDDFYAELRWDGWQEEVAAVPLSSGLSVYPPLHTQESRPVDAASRRPAGWSEVTGFLDDLAAQVAAGTFQFRIAP